VVRKAIKGANAGGEFGRVRSVPMSLNVRMDDKLLLRIFGAYCADFMAGGLTVFVLPSWVFSEALKTTIRLVFNLLIWSEG
jgi:hypothetical protein